jgi:hypothetical protein
VQRAVDDDDLMLLQYPVRSPAVPAGLPAERQAGNEQSALRIAVDVEVGPGNLEPVQPEFTDHQ